ncbi:MAG: TonB-dependent receptor [Bacteroidetes bacterium]|nr:TonB-dependent receptor [Bacteroidota bacterium]
MAFNSHFLPVPFKEYFFVIKLFTIVALLATLNTHAQTTIVSGSVKDSMSNHLLPGVNVLLNNETGTSTNQKGYFILELEPGTHQLVFSIIGYESVTKKIKVEQNENKILDVQLVHSSLKIDEVVVTASRYEQRLSDVSVSMGILKPAFIGNINTKDIDQTLNYMPGVEVMDGQASIRGGSGYSFGAGSRVLVLVDDLPMLTAADGDVKWNFLPVENIAQVEVLKGASSALYGSSALNGIINIRTKYPETEPQTTVTLYSGFYQKPKRKEMAWWWQTNPLFSGISFSHSQKIKNVDIVAGANGLIDPGYRESNYDERIRANLKLRHTPSSVKGLSYGLNTNFQLQQLSDFLIWRDADSGAFLQNPAVITPVDGFRLNVDPWITYFDKKLNKHAVKMRYYSVKNKFDENPDKNNASELYYGEYQFHSVFNDNLNLTTGFSGLAGKTRAELYGDHFNSTLALFTQLDYKFFRKLSANLGLRWERYALDDKDKESGFVTRAGLNYQAAKATFIRASFGQGYRFPSIAEKYTATSLGSLNIFPNPNLKSETGWSSEMGIRQGLTTKNWTSFIDAAFFWTEYNNMIEFIFGVYKPDSVVIPSLDHVGFKSLNVGKARITGFETGITGNGNIGKLPVNLFVGYTYMNPVDLTSDTLSNNILKYRYRHSLKGDASVDIQKFSFGISVVYRSFMERIDAAFEEKILGQEIFPGLKKYRQENNHGNWVFDFRLACNVTSSTRLSIIVKNLFNKEYMGRPGDIQPPGNITFQAVVKF